MLKLKQREALNRIIEILEENEGAAEILRVKMESLVALRDM